MIRKYLDGLLSNSKKMQDIPERVQEILYNYIKDKGYFPKKYLSTYQIIRVDFNFYGGKKKLEVDQVGMILAFLIISGITVQQILLHMKENFVEFKKCPNIDITAKYIGSIMHYLTIDTFISSPTKLKDIFSLMNYYRNYHIYNEELENDNLYNVFRDEDEYAQYLIPKSSITEFWNLEVNLEFINFFKKFVYSWACTLGKSIILKYQKYNNDLLQKKN